MKAMLYAQLAVPDVTEVSSRQTITGPTSATADRAVDTMFAVCNTEGVGVGGEDTWHLLGASVTIVMVRIAGNVK